jgi:hypothetical protein
MHAHDHSAVHRLSTLQTNSQVYADENTHLTHGGLHKAGNVGAGAFGQDAKRGKTNILPAARTTLGDIR